MNSPQQHKEIALQRFSQGYNCAQSVFTVFAEEAGLREEEARRIAALFGGGIGRTGQTCGAVTGALMALGLIAAHNSLQDSEAKDRLNQLAQRFMEEFRQQNQATHCQDLIGFDLREPEGHHLARQSGVFTERCPKFVESAVMLLDEILSQQREDNP